MLFCFINFVGLEAIKIIKKKRTYGGRLLEEFMKKALESYIGGGAEPVDEEIDSPAYEEIDSSFLNVKENLKGK